MSQWLQPGQMTPHLARCFSHEHAGIKSRAGRPPRHPSSDFSKRQNEERLVGRGRVYQERRATHHRVRGAVEKQRPQQPLIGPGRQTRIASLGFPLWGYQGAVTMNLAPHLLNF